MAMMVVLGGFIMDLEAVVLEVVQVEIVVVTLVMVVVVMVMVLMWGGVGIIDYAMTCQDVSGGDGGVGAFITDLQVLEVIQVRKCAGGYVVAMAVVLGEMLKLLAEQLAGEVMAEMASDPY